MKRMTVFFSGTVQGVGFRLTAESLARRFPVTGYVCNLDDGRVEVVTEGKEAALVEFLSAIRHSRMKDYIRQVEACWSEAQGCFKGFRITCENKQGAIEHPSGDAHGSFTEPG